MTGSIAGRRSCARGWGHRVTALALALALAGGGAAGARAAEKVTKGEAPPKGANSSSKPALATSKSGMRARAKAAVERAQIDYKLGRFQAALEGYRSAYELVQSPVLLFDMGQCHRNLDDPEKAIFFFEGYLREESKPEPEQRQLTQDLIADSRVALQKKQAAIAAARAAAAARVAAAARAAALVQRPAPRPRLTLEAGGDRTADGLSLMGDRDGRRPQGGHRSIASRWWFWTAVAGACAVAAGAAVYYATGEPRLVAPSGTVGPLDRSMEPR
jgi:tetratricopeptide (TPR) repeat protein